MRQWPSLIQSFSLLLAGSLCLSLTSGCHLFPVQYQTRIGADNGYSLEIPDFCKALETTDPDLLLNEGDIYRDFYLVLRRDSLSGLQAKFPENELMDYYDFHMENLLQDIQEPVAPGPDSLLIGGLPTLYGGYKGYYKGDALAFRLGMIQSPAFQYQLLMWTREDQMQEYSAIMDSVMHSFKAWR